MYCLVCRVFFKNAELFGDKEVEISIPGKVDNQNVVKVYLDKYVIVRSKMYKKANGCILNA